VIGALRIAQLSRCIIGSRTRILLGYRLFSSLNNFHHLLRIRFINTQAQKNQRDNLAGFFVVPINSKEH
jgi:catechol-2,3-dioxygenase